MTLQADCEICGQPARGKNFGALSCRACAAFFRRTHGQPVRECKKSKKCNLRIGNGWYQCKKCRMEKCLSVGMTPDNFQFDHEFQKQRISPTVETFVGRPFCVINCEPEELKLFERLVKCDSLVEKGRRILTQGSEKPITTKNCLIKMSVGLQKMEGGFSSPVKMLHSYGKEETLSFWEKDFMRTAKFLTYFDKFQMLNGELQMQILSSVWHVWSRLDKLATTALGRRRKMCGDLVMICNGDEYSVIDLKNIEVDFRWCARLTNQQMQFFYDTSENHLIYQLLPEMMKLNPSHVELSFMLCHLILNHAGQRFQGEILKVTDYLIQGLADNLHDYYVNELDQPRYAARLSQMLKINQKIREDVLKTKSRRRIAHIFDVHTIKFTHMECFEDLGM